MIPFKSHIDKRITSVIAKELSGFEASYAGQFQLTQIEIQPIFNYLHKTRGKHFRPILFFLSQGLISKPNIDSVSVAVMLEMLHFATLIHDDVIDDSSERRGAQTINFKWGNQISVLAGDYLFARVLALGVKSPWSEVLEVISRVVQRMAYSELKEAMDILDESMTVEDYFTFIHDKTGSLIAASCELGGIVAHAPKAIQEQLYQLGSDIGVAFQIRDDILDMSGSSGSLGKPIKQDLSNGKITLPLIFALKKATSDEKIDFRKKLNRLEPSDETWIIEFIQQKEGICRAQEEAEMFTQNALKKLDQFIPSVYKESLQQLIQYNLEREA
jgi:octaprenyl-diphosphate synthase